MRRLIPVVLVLALVGCGERELVVESDTLWVGYIYNERDDTERRVTGYDNQTYRDLGGGKICWSFQMTASSYLQGDLRVYMAEPMILGTSERGVATTSAPGGTVSGCSDD